jgi:hypothetical protein
LPKSDIFALPWKRPVDTAARTPRARVSGLHQLIDDVQEHLFLCIPWRHEIKEYFQATARASRPCGLDRSGERPPQVPGHRLEIAIGGEQGVSAGDAESADDQVDGLAHGDAETAQTAMMARREDGELYTLRGGWEGEAGSEPGRQG